MRVGAGIGLLGRGRVGSLRQSVWGIDRKRSTQISARHQGVDRRADCGVTRVYLDGDYQRVVQTRACDPGERGDRVACRASVGRRGQADREAARVDGESGRCA